MVGVVAQAEPGRSDPPVFLAAADATWLPVEHCGRVREDRDSLYLVASIVRKGHWQHWS